MCVIDDLPLPSETRGQLTMWLPLQDCVLVLEDAEIPCQRMKLAEVSGVLRKIIFQVPNGSEGPLRLPLLGDHVMEVAPLLNLAYRDSSGCYVQPYKANEENLEAAMYCHDKYDCQALRTAVDKYMSWAQDHGAPQHIMAVFKASIRFNLESSHEHCGTILAGRLPEIKRSENPSIKAGFAKLAPSDIAYLEELRHNMLEEYLVATAEMLQPSTLREITHVYDVYGDNAQLEAHRSPEFWIGVDHACHRINSVWYAKNERIRLIRDSVRLHLRSFDL